MGDVQLALRSCTPDPMQLYTRKLRRRLYSVYSTSAPSGILIHPAVWPQQTWAEKWGCCCAIFRRVELGPHLTQCHLPKTSPISLPSGIMIHSAVWHYIHGPRFIRTLRPKTAKVGGSCCAPFRVRGTGSRSNTMWPGPGDLPPYEVAS